MMKAEKETQGRKAAESQRKGTRERGSWLTTAPFASLRLGVKKTVFELVNDDAVQLVSSWHERKAAKSQRRKEKGRANEEIG